MILSYKECINKYGNDYQLARAIAEEKVYRVESGMYSTDKYEEELAVIVKKYPNAILTGEYAFYCHDLTDVIPEKYFIATKKNSVKLKDTRIVQVYVSEELLLLGAITKEIHGVTVKIYDKEIKPVKTSVSPSFILIFLSSKSRLCSNVASVFSLPSSSLTVI